MSTRCLRRHFARSHDSSARPRTKDQWPMTSIWWKKIGKRDILAMFSLVNEVEWVAAAGYCRAHCLALLHEAYSPTLVTWSFSRSSVPFFSAGTAHFIYGIRLGTIHAIYWGYRSVVLQSLHDRLKGCLLRTFVRSICCMKLVRSSPRRSKQRAVRVWSMFSATAQESIQHAPVRSYLHCDHTNSIGNSLCNGRSGNGPVRQ